MSPERKRFLYFLASYLVVGAIVMWLGYQMCQDKHKRELADIEFKLNDLLCERDSLVSAYEAEAKMFDLQIDSLKVLARKRKILKDENYRKISEPLPANAIELEKQMYELLKMIRGEVLPNKE